MSLPKIIQYGNIKPRGFATKYRRWEVNPQASYNTFSPSELVRFNIQTDGFIDPYNSYIVIEVEVDNVQQGVAANNPFHLELDGQSTSLISSMVIYSDSKEIERIDEYDQLGQILADLGMPDNNKAHKQYEGYGFDAHFSNLGNEFFQANHCSTGSVLVSTSGGSIIQSYKQCAMRPTNILQAYRGDLSQGIPLNDQVTLENYQQRFNQFSYGRSDGVYDTPTIYALDQQDSEYGIECYDQYIRGNQDALNAQYPHQNGFKIPYSNSLSDNKSQYLSYNLKALKIVNGKFTKEAVDCLQYQVAPNTGRNYEITKQRFIVPILSGVLGILIPRDQWKLIPGKALKQLMFEFRLNPYAFFTAGQFHASSTTVSQKRSWKISKFSMVFDLWNFDQQVESQIDQMLNGEGIILSSNSWSLGPMYQIIANGTVTNNWQINNGIESVKALLFWFIPNDYLVYTHCRKQFRISMNILRYQLKIGPDFIPPYPIQGHAGNIAMNTVILADNTEFVQELHKTFGFFFSADRKIKINKTNFAINERSYPPDLETSDVTNKGLCIPLFEERRCVGKAIYALNLDSNPTDPDVLSGLDTTQKRPIELIIRGSDNDKFPRDSTMYVMLNHDFYVQFTNNGTKTYGQG